MAVASTDVADAKRKVERKRVAASDIMPGCRAYLKQRELEPDAKENTDFKIIFARGRCVGIVETLLWHMNDFCLPPESNIEDAVRVVVQYIDRREFNNEMRFSDYAHEALQEAWPCKR